ncbi:MAG: DUF2065 domain-containing protein [Pseudomonadota bacterium]
MSDLIVAIGLVLVLEGLIYAVFPGSMRKMVEEMARLPDASLRSFGLGALCVGVFIVWLVRG